MRTIVSAGRGGDLLWVDGTIERHPGDDSRFSEFNVLRDLTGHELNMSRICMRCDVILSIAAWTGGRLHGKRQRRAAYLRDPDVAELRERVQKLVPSWHVDSVLLPMSLCGNCVLKAYSDATSKSFSSVSAKSLKPYLEERASRACDGTVCLVPQVARSRFRC